MHGKILLSKICRVELKLKTPQAPPRTPVPSMSAGAYFGALGLSFAGAAASAAHRLQPHREQSSLAQVLIALRAHA